MAHFTHDYIVSMLMHFFGFQFIIYDVTSSTHEFQMLKALYFNFPGFLNASTFAFLGNN